MPKISILILTLFICLNNISRAENSRQKDTTSHGHAHNDYLHKRPCLDALDNGFHSVEADVFLVKDLLLIGHFGLFLKPERSLESLYLKPLQEHVKKFGGKVSSSGGTFFLWIELKTDAQQTYSVLKKVLAEYADILTRYENGKVVPGAVTVVMTGNAKVALIRNEPVLYAGVDGNRWALDSDIAPHLVPTVSLDWREEFPQFKTELSAADQEKLAEYVRKAREKGRKLRFWNAPDNESVWKILSDAGVDLINTDRLEELRLFLEKRKEK